MPCENSHNRGARGDSSFMLDAMVSSSEKPPLQMRSIKWWEYVTEVEWSVKRILCRLTASLPLLLDASNTYLILQLFSMLFRGCFRFTGFDREIEKSFYNIDSG